MILEEKEGDRAGEILRYYENEKLCEKINYKDDYSTWRIYIVL